MAKSGMLSIDISSEVNEKPLLGLEGD